MNGSERSRRRRRFPPPCGPLAWFLLWRPSERDSSPSRRGGGMWLARPFAVVLALLPLAFCRGPGTEEPQTKVLPPSNVKIKTYNFKSSLHWDYQNMLPEPLFTVEILCYGSGHYTEVVSCVNISQHYCDLTHKINKECDFLWAKVKAVVGSRESEYMESAPFYLFRNAKIGPPKFNLSVDNDQIIVDIEHPFTPDHGKNLFSEKDFIDFSYQVLLWNQSSPQMKYTFEPQECNMYMCVAYLDAPLGFTYCVSVQGTLPAVSITGEKSNASCILLPSRQSFGEILAIIGGCVVVVIALVVLALLLAYRQAKRRNIPLPKSLVSIVRSIKPVNSFETKPDGKYATVSSLLYKPVCEDGSPVDHSTEAETSDLEDSGKIGIESQNILEVTVEESCESEQSHEASDTYFKSVSGQDEICNSLPNGDVPRADVQQPTDLGASRKVSGYDKPHWIGSEPPVA